MVHRFLLLGGVLMGLAACHNNPYAMSGSSYAPEPVYDNPAAARDAEQGCASGQQADLIHQNRPGGSDYNPLRCRTQGY